MKQVCYCLLLLPVVAQAAEPGRLFYTPQQRLQIDARRSLEQAAAEPGASEVRLRGVVRRSDGKTTLWINGAAPERGRAGSQPGSATIALPDGTQAEMRVGDKWRVGEKPSPSVRVTRGVEAGSK